MVAGTLYGAIENLLKLKFIQLVESGNSRRKVYMITEAGKEMLRLDSERMQIALCLIFSFKAERRYRKMKKI